MISIEDELAIHDALDEGKSYGEIARTLGVCKTTVYYISNARAKAASVPAEKALEAKALLLAGLSISAVEVRVNIPRDVVIAIRRVTCAQLRRSKYDSNVSPSKCPTCGAPILPSVQHDYVTRLPPTGFAYSDSVELFRIVEDLIGLGSTNMIHNLLFLNLVSRSREVIGAILGEPNGQETNISARTREILRDKSA